jgi:hypothetical protein
MQMLADTLPAPIQAYRPGGGGQQTGEDAQQRGFAGPVRPDHHERPPGRRRHGEALEQELESSSAGKVISYQRLDSHALPTPAFWCIAHSTLLSHDRALKWLYKARSRAVQGGGEKTSTVKGGAVSVDHRTGVFQP